MFFFSIGATFNFGDASQVVIPAVILAALMLLIKPFLFRILLLRSGEKSSVASEVGLRLGQASEFSLLVATLASRTKLLSEAGSNLIQATTILTFIVSSYLVVLRYPTPIALSENMRKD